MAPVPPELLARYEDLLDVVPEADHKLVFGRPTCLVGGHMFFGVHPSGLFLRLPPPAAEELLAAGGAAFEPMAGRVMGGFFVLPADCPDTEQWVRRAYDHAVGMPPKTPRVKSPKS